MEEKVSRIKEIVSLMRDASVAYYRDDNPIMTDKQYDDLYDELIQLEDITEYVMAGSPTQHVQGEIVEKLHKVKHKSPMLSANKTKNLSEIRSFIENKEAIQSWKLDGLTVVAEYKKGVLKQAVTRGNGTEGEDVTHTFKHCINLPTKLLQPVDVTFRGECVIPWKTFREINNELDEPYAHPRNLAAGSLRQLNSNISRNRRLEYYVFEVLYGENNTVSEDYLYAKKLGMPVVDYLIVNDLNRNYEQFNPNAYRLPADGIIYRYNDKKYGSSLGRTEHHPLDMMALKWQDEEYETTIQDVIWTMGKTSTLTPVAIFDPVDIDGTTVTKASLHNVNIFKSYHLKCQDSITVYLANKIIPQVAKNLNMNSNIGELFKIPDVCPICGAPTKIVKSNLTETLECTNSNCKGSILGMLSSAVSKNALNIDSLSDATLEKFIDLGWVKNIRDIYHLSAHKKQLEMLDGFGSKSTKNLLDSIERSRSIKLENFLCALSVPFVGKAASKEISRMCDGDKNTFFWIMSERGAIYFKSISGIGMSIISSLQTFWNKNKDDVIALSWEFYFKKEDITNSGKLKNKNFVITGTLNRFGSRDELKEKIESMGGKVTGSVSLKTDALINNDISSNSSKNKRAKQLGIKIITEDDVIKLMEV